MSTQEDSFAGRAARMRDWLAPSIAEDWPNLPVTHAEGSYLYGLDGRRYLDFLAGFAVCGLGHRHPRVVAAAKEQIDRLIHGAVGVVAYDPLLRLCEELARVTPGDLDAFFWGNSGTEAVEGAIKLARYVTGRQAVVGFIGGFHGRALGSASLTTSNVKYRRGIEPLLPSIHHVPFPYCYRCPHRAGSSCCDDPLASLDRLFRHVVAPEDVAAVVVEPILGEGGYVVPPPDFLPRLREVCDRHGILLVFDEIQTGFGRTGEMFAAQTFGVTPDILLLAKAIASGFPLSAIAASPALMRQWPAGTHGTTFGGNPVSCAAAVATLEALRDERVLENVRARSAEAMERLGALAARSPYVGDVRGKGLMIGVEFVDPDRDGAPAGPVVRRLLELCLERGLLLYPAGLDGHVLRISPPLNLTAAELDRGLSILEESVAALPAPRRGP